MISYQEYSKNDIENIEYKQFLHELDKFESNFNDNLLESNYFLNESVFKDAFKFIIQVSKEFNVNLKKITEGFKNKKIYMFFKKIGFSIKKFFSLIKMGYKKYLLLFDIISEYIQSNKIVKFTEKELKKLDEFLQKHPAIKKITGLVVAGMLLYIWWNMSFTGDFKNDFDQSWFFMAIEGNYSLTQIFASKEGVKMLFLFVTAITTGITFPWSGKSIEKLIFSFLFTAINKYKKG